MNRKSNSDIQTMSYFTKCEQCTKIGKCEDLAAFSFAEKNLQRGSTKFNFSHMSINNNRLKKKNFEKSISNFYHNQILDRSNRLYMVFQNDRDRYNWLNLLKFSNKTLKHDCNWTFEKEPNINFDLFEYQRFLTGR